MRSLKPGYAEYSLSGYGKMIADSVRMRAYHSALAASIRPGDTVLDLGAGPGIMALLACKLGAARVYAVEPSDAIAVGIELARANGYADRIEFIQASSFDTKLEHKAGVMVSDLRGVLPLHGRHIPSLVDARRRLLAPGAIQIPQRDTIRAQLIDDAELHAEELRVWQDGAFGLDLSPALRWAAHGWRKTDLSRSKRVGPPREIVTLDYRTIKSANARAEAQWTLEQDQTVHGLGVWFETVLADGIGFSNSPDQPRAVYGQALFPFSRALALRRGDSIRVVLAATLVKDNYVWQWETTVKDSLGHPTVALRQSSFQATPVNPARLWHGTRKT